MKSGRQKEPVELAQYARLRKRKSIVIRCAAAALLLCGALLLKLYFPQGAAVLRDCLADAGTLDRAVAAFYEKTAEGDLGGAIAVFSEELNG